MPQDLLPEPSPLPGGSRIVPVDDVFEHYRIFRREDGSLWELGRGAMGVTYKAIDTKLDKLVALKIINTQLLGQGNTQKRFRREARTAASLHHRHIASVHYLGETNGGFFYAMEFVDGETIEAIVKRDGPLPWKQAFGITLQITRALMAAHAKNLVHRDIKPANIMLVNEVDEQGVAKLIDFGLAKSAVEEAAASNVVTNASGFLGTPLYASPEQCEEVPADIRSDIYSLGVTLWFMLTGHPTFQGNLAKVFHQQLHAPPPLEQLPTDLPLSARALLAKMLAKDRADRPQTPTELRDRLDEHLHEQSGAVIPIVQIAPELRQKTLQLATDSRSRAEVAANALSLPRRTTETIAPDTQPTEILYTLPSGKKYSRRFFVWMAAMATVCLLGATLAFDSWQKGGLPSRLASSVAAENSSKRDGSSLTTPTLSTSSTMVSPSSASASTVVSMPVQYYGEVPQPGEPSGSVRVSIVLDPDGKTGIIHYDSRLGRTSVRFAFTRKGDGIQGITQDVAAKPDHVRWNGDVFAPVDAASLEGDMENNADKWDGVVFSLHFSADKSEATYEPVIPKTGRRIKLKLGS